MTDKLTRRLVRKPTRAFKEGMSSVAGRSRNTYTEGSKQFAEFELGVKHVSDSVGPTTTDASAPEIPDIGEDFFREAAIRMDEVTNAQRRDLLQHILDNHGSGDQLPARVMDLQLVVSLDWLESGNPDTMAELKSTLESVMQEDFVLSPLLDKSTSMMIVPKTKGTIGESGLQNALKGY